MGRKKKYITEDEKKISNREKYMRFYWKNKDKIKKINLQRYYAKKINN